MPNTFFFFTVIFHFLQLEMVIWHIWGQQDTSRSVLDRSSGDVFALLIEETEGLHSPYLSALNVGVFLYLR